MPKDKIFTLSEKQLFVIYNRGQLDLQKYIQRKTGVKHFMSGRTRPQKFAKAIKDAQRMKFNDQQSPLLHPKKKS